MNFAGGGVDGDTLETVTFRAARNVSESRADTPISVGFQRATGNGHNPVRARPASISSPH